MDNLFFAGCTYSSSIPFGCFEKKKKIFKTHRMFFVKTSSFLGILFETLEIFPVWEKNSYQADALAISKYSLPLRQQKTVLFIAAA